MDRDARRSGVPDRPAAPGLHWQDAHALRPARRALSGAIPSDPDSFHRVCWVDGAIVPLDEPVVRGDDSAFSLGLGCYTAARVEGGRIRYCERHVERLVGGARALHLGEVDPDSIRRAFAELTKAAFGDRPGVIRLQLSRDGAGALHLVGVPRAIGPEPDTWRATIAALPHDGAELSGGLKVTSRLTLTLVVEAARAAGFEEAILLDAAGRLVEAAGSNLFVSPDGREIVTPPLALGAVAGISRTLVLERVPEVVERNVSRDELFAAREVIATNSVRGARAVVEIDDQRIGDGATGPWAARLDAALAE